MSRYERAVEMLEEMDANWEALRPPAPHQLLRWRQVFRDTLCVLERAEKVEDWMVEWLHKEAASSGSDWFGEFAISPGNLRLIADTLQAILDAKEGE